MVDEATKVDTFVATGGSGNWTYRYNCLITDPNARLLRGAIWAAALSNEEWVPSALYDLGLRCALNLLNQKIANTCVVALGEVTPVEAIPRLARLRLKIRFRATLKQIDRTMDELASRTGVSKSEMIELAIPDFGLAVDGTKEVPVAGAAAALLKVEAPDKVNLHWRTKLGDEQRFAPKEIAESSDLNALKRHIKEIKDALRVERLRLEDLMTEERRTPHAMWAERALGHPLTRSFARTLIWQVWSGDDARLGMPLDGKTLTDVLGNSFKPHPKAEFQLWHPIFSPADEVLEWRRFILEREIRQPFKQAFREIYRLTPPETETQIYSNRFAAHILRYPQTRALIGARGWFGNTLGPWDGGFDGTAKKLFDARGFRAEFYMEQVEDENQMGAIAELCSSDQVRFYSTRPPSPDPVPLADIPPVVFSEAMRDVDLFVSVSSIAADPEWLDRGEDRHIAYWRQTSFGNLSAMAQVRREALAHLVSRLNIADRCHLTDRHLVVRGEKRTYKIHIGSGNILMEPNDEYLCIVPSRVRSTKKSSRFLPFEDDYMLSIILSKAFMLAADHKIKDKQILDQIGR